jgi:hypothetical protein
MRGKYFEYWNGSYFDTFVDRFESEKWLELPGD